MTAPLIVADCGDGRDHAASSLVREGWTRIDGFQLDAAEWNVGDRRVVCVGDVDDSDDAAAAVLAAARGAAVVARAPSDNRIAAGLVEDLARVGDVEYSIRNETLLAEDREVLALVGQGYRVPEIARIVHLSPRTVDRRLVRARKALGVDTTTQALALVFGTRRIGEE